MSVENKEYRDNINFTSQMDGLMKIVQGNVVAGVDEENDEELLNEAIKLEEDEKNFIRQNLEGGGIGDFNFLMTLNKKTQTDIKDMVDEETSTRFFYYFQ